MRKKKITTGMAINTHNWEIIFIYSIVDNGSINYTSYNWGMGSMGSVIVDEQIEMFSTKNKKHMRALHGKLSQAQEDDGRCHHVGWLRGDAYTKEILRGEKERLVPR